MCKYIYKIASEKYGSKIEGWPLLFRQVGEVEVEATATADVSFFGEIDVAASEIVAVLTVFVASDNEGESSLTEVFEGALEELGTVVEFVVAVLVVQVAVDDGILN